MSSWFQYRARRVSGIRIIGATANIRSPRLRAEKEPLEQSNSLTCCNLTRKTKLAGPVTTGPTSSLHLILRGSQTVICSHWTTVNRILQPHL
jgi:hypothetical protein